MTISESEYRKLKSQNIIHTVNRHCIKKGKSKGHKGYVFLGLFCFDFLNNINNKSNLFYHIRLFLSK